MFGSVQNGPTRGFSTGPHQQSADDSQHTTSCSEFVRDGWEPRSTLRGGRDGVGVARQCSPNWVQTSHLRFSGVAAHAIWEAPKTISIPHSVKPRSAFDRCQSELA